MDGEPVGDATALMTGALLDGPTLDGATLDGNELGTSLADAVDATGDEATLALDAGEAE